MTDYATILMRRYAGREWTINADDYEQLTMLDGGDKPTKTELDAVWPAVQQEIAAEKAAQATARASALAKLAALGLTENEITALVSA